MQNPATLVSVEEYLRTSYEGPDREYLDGVVVERNLGEKQHSRTQRRLIEFFAYLERTLKTFSFPEQRVQVKATRFRVPDVCVYLDQEPDEEIFTRPPFLVIEILSPDDRHRDTMERIDDYISFGTPYVWVIDPAGARGYVYTTEGGREVKDGVLRTQNPGIELPLAELLA
jgi:Uma2 family endonuclease